MLCLRLLLSSVFGQLRHSCTCFGQAVVHFALEHGCAILAGAFAIPPVPAATCKRLMTNVPSLGTFVGVTEA
jgi:hypothetical protein